MTTPNDQADLSLALVAHALEKARSALGVPALDELHKRCPATFAALATALGAAEADVKALRATARGRQPMHPGLAASIEALTGAEPIEHDVDALCNVCQVQHHDSCAGNPNCPCCCYTMANGSVP